MSAVRLVLAAGLALGVCAVALPVVEDATASRADAAARSEARNLAVAVDDLLESDAVVGPGARRVLEVDVPDGPGTGVAYVAVGGAPDGPVPGDDADSDVITYRVDGGERRVAARLPVDVRAGPDDAAALVLRDDARVVLRLDRRGDAPVVRVTVRGFFGGNGTSRPHA